MLSSLSIRMRLGSIILEGLLLVSSLPALALTQTSNIHTSMQSMLVGSTIVPTETYTNSVRKQLQWNSIQSNPVFVTAQPKESTEPANTNTKIVQVASASQKQVSRSDSSELVDHALSLQGIPYVFGGTSRSGFDCSGYSQYVFRGSGISLPRTASEQFNVGSSVSRGQLQSGDMVFFTTYAPGASHVGIYIGGGRFVSASNRGVSISNLGSNYYASRYLGARRVS